MNALLNLDQSLFLYINPDAAHPFFDPVMLILSSRALAFACVGVVAVYGIRARNWDFVAKLIFVSIALILIDTIVYELVKPYFGRLRPCRTLGDQVRIVAGCAGSLGFPSNHATNGMLVGTMALLLFGRIVGFGVLILVTLIGFSRIYLGVHYPLDVLAGFALGGLCGWLFFRLWRYLEKRFPPRLRQ